MAKMAEPVSRDETPVAYNDGPRSGSVHAYAQATLFSQQRKIIAIDEMGLNGKHVQLSTSALIPNPAYGVGIETV